MESQLDDRVLSYLRSVYGSTAWAIRGHVGERDRPTISRALQRLKRKGLVRTDSLHAAYWKAVPAQKEPTHD
jgi:hypothetical protein